MSETPDVQQFAQAAADLCGHWLDGICVDCIAKAIAAAEERGRRAGIEEAAKFVEQFDGCMHGECFVEGIRALAPRDSGKDLAAADPADRFAKDRK